MDPQKVILRNHRAATITGRVNDLGAFVFVGNTGNTIECWREDGSWREDGREHPFDIIFTVDVNGALFPMKGGSK